MTSPVPPDSWRTRHFARNGHAQAFPDNTITELDPGLGFVIEQDYRKGRGLCAAECPSSAIEMHPEDDAG